jgi:hypothetical protein
VVTVARQRELVERLRVAPPRDPPGSFGISWPMLALPHSIPFGDSSRRLCVIPYDCRESAVCFVTSPPVIFVISSLAIIGAMAALMAEVNGRYRAT